MMNNGGFSDNRRALLATVLFHGALLLALLVVPVRFRVEEQPKFYELSLAAVSPQPAERNSGGARPQRTAARTVPQPASPRERVEAPRRRMVEPEKPAITVPEPRRTESKKVVAATEKPVRETPAPQPEPVRTEPAPPAQESAKAAAESKDASDDTPAATSTGTGSETNPDGGGAVGNFRIEGDIKGRSVIYNPLPIYPEGLNRNATIRISFTVLPDGSVSPMGMIPVRKENAILEDLSMSMLKRWRFSPLPAGDKRTQRGVITFYYKVR